MDKAISLVTPSHRSPKQSPLGGHHHTVNGGVDVPSDSVGDTSDSGETQWPLWQADPVPQWTQGLCGWFYRHGPAVMNGCLTACALVLVITSALAQKSTVTDMCSDCHTLLNTAMAVGCVFSSLAVFASVAQRRGYRWFLVLYFVSLILIALSLLGMTTAGGVMTVEVDLGPAWRSRVEAGSQQICDLQESYECSGWRVCCGPGNASHPEPPVNNTDLENCYWHADECLSSCKGYQNRSRPCREAIQHWLLTTLVLFLVGVIVSLAIMASLCLWYVRVHHLLRSERKANGC
eukprot:TRINITY_DN37020_c0_g1_i1.p1 TRINITY_DN37020_c0_g1~~TRINITY_DN37020_c0_g1_i1.p1  ORF type:complete len:291 (+),score=51.95 TRINITY_DN37020_c0_g1_i1:46-918(+)